MEEKNMGIRHPEEIIQPADIRPVLIRDYPSKIEESESHRRAARSYTKELKHQMENITAEVMKEIEAETVQAVSGVRNPHLELKKKYKSQGSRLQELRIRLSKIPEYEELRLAHDEWSDKSSEWASYVNRLRRELRIKEIEYTHGTI